MSEQSLNGQSLAPTAPVRPEAPTFAALGARQETVEALAAAGITRAFAIQEYALPIALRGVDLIGQAPTGTGKTLGFGIPLLERVFAPSEGSDGVPQALVVVPTRELGIQVAKDLDAAGRTRGVRVLPIYGGVAYEPQIDALRKGVEILVGTPGRLMDLQKQKHLRLDRVHALVLDEADRMLDLGFLDDVEKILAMLPEDRQTMLFSATMPDPIVTPVPALPAPADDDPRRAHRRDRPVAADPAAGLPHPLDEQGRDRGADPPGGGARADHDLHPHQAGRRPGRRGSRLPRLRGGRGARRPGPGRPGAGAAGVPRRQDRHLVATDVAARGIDVTGVTHVINYDCPEDQDTYTHRIGRTGRAGATGVAVTFVDWDDMPRWRIIDKTLGLDMPEPPETYHTSRAPLHRPAHLPDITGTLPTAERTRAGLSAEVEEDLGGGRSRRGDSGGGARERGESRGERPRSSAAVAATAAATARRRHAGLAEAPATPPPRKAPVPRAAGDAAGPARRSRASPPR